jgi:hypothetical protein
MTAMAEESETPVVRDHTLNNIDIRLSFNGGNEGITKRENDATGTEITYDEEASGGIAAHVLYLRAPAGGIGFAVGGGLSAFTHEGKPENTIGQQAKIETLSIDIYGAFVYRPTKQWHFELPALVLSGGSSKVKTEDRTEEDEGTYSRLALQVGAYYTFDFGLQVGADLGVAGFSSSVDREISPGVKQELIYTGGGGFLNLNIGYRF